MANEHSFEIHNIGSYTFKQTGNATKSDDMGMREMQKRAYEKRDSQYLLIQAPPACGKSRALMFLALDKVIHQGLKKVIIAIPQLSIGGSFADTNLTEHGFFADWKIDPQYNLCMPGGEDQKVAKAVAFLSDADGKYLLCSHATLCYFFAKVEDHSLFNNTLVAVDEFHHVSEDDDNRLGGVIHTLMTETSAHIIAMTGSYFRGDSVPVLSDEDEAKFERVTYTYYEQLNGYKYLKSLGIDYAFYTGNWVDAVSKVLDLSKKTIIHIPSVNSRESTGDKYNEVGKIFDFIGEVIVRDSETGIYTFKSKDGRTLHVADLITDTDGMQGITMASLRKPEVLNSLDIILALGMAKEGFDWPQCEYALTVGYRSSLTEVVQIIGRATRDCEGKTHAQFTNLLAMPSALLADVEDAVNSLLKAITLSLLMEQVLAPNVHFRKRGTEGTDDGNGNGTAGTSAGNPSDINITIDDENVSQQAIDIVNAEGIDITEKILNSSSAVQNALANGGEGVNKDLVVEDIADIIRKSHPELSDYDIDAMSQAIMTAIIVKVLTHGAHPETAEGGDDTQGNGATDGADGTGGSKGNESGEDNNGPKPFVVVNGGDDEEGNNAFVNIDGKFMNLDDIDFNLIESVNPFAGAYNFISKTIEPELLRQIQAKALAMREKMTMQKAMQLWPYINQFVKEHNRKPNLNTNNDFERRLAVALEYLAEQKRKQNAKSKTEA